MPSFNKVMLMGHVGSVPDVRVTAAGKTVVKVSVATHHHRKLGDDTWQEETDWHSVVMFGPLAERQRDRIQRGDLIFVEGRLRKSTWTSEDGQPRSKVEVIARWLRNLGRLQPRGGPVERLFDEDHPLSDEPAIASLAPATAVPGANGGADADIPF